MPKRSGFKIYEPLGVEGGAVIAGFEVKVRPGRAARGASKADNVPCIHPVSGLDVTARKMAVEGFQAIGVAYHHKVAVTSHIFGDANLAVKGCGNRSAGWIRQVYALVTAPVTVAVKRTGLHLVGAAVGIQGIHHPN